jgi:hypothetical protein
LTVRAAYDEDFYLWSQEQARLLRDLPRATALPNSLDLAHIAEEIEDMGKSELARVQSNLIQMLAHIIKLASSRPNAEPFGHWIDEIIAFRVNADAHFTPGMRQLIDLEHIWRKARKRAADALSQSDQDPLQLPANCPFALDELIGDEIPLKTMVGRLVAINGGNNLDRN